MTASPNCTRSGRRRHPSDPLGASRQQVPWLRDPTHVPERGYCFYLTNLSRSLGPRQVADISPVRWEIELNDKLDKSSHRLDEIDARTPAAVHALIHATIIASVLVGLIVHRHNLAIVSQERA